MQRHKRSSDRKHSSSLDSSSNSKSSKADKAETSRKRRADISSTSYHFQKQQECLIRDSDEESCEEQFGSRRKVHSGNDGARGKSGKSSSSAGKSWDQHDKTKKSQLR